MATAPTVGVAARQGSLAAPANAIATPPALWRRAVARLATASAGVRMADATVLAHAVGLIARITASALCGTAQNVITAPAVAVATGTAFIAVATTHGGPALLVPARWRACAPKTRMARSVVE